MSGNFFGQSFFGGGFFKGLEPSVLPGGGKSKRRRKLKLRYIGDPAPDVLPPEMPITYPESVHEPAREIEHDDDDVIIHAVIAMKLLH